MAAAAAGEVVAGAVAAVAADLVVVAGPAAVAGCRAPRRQWVARHRLAVVAERGQEAVFRGRPAEILVVAVLAQAAERSAAAEILSAALVPAAWEELGRAAGLD